MCFRAATDAAGKHVARVDPDGTAEEFGDEPLLDCAGEAGVPVYVARQRYEAGLLASEAGVKPDSDGGEDRFGPLCIFWMMAFSIGSSRATWTFCCSIDSDWQDGLLAVAGNLPRAAQSRFAGPE